MITKKDIAKIEKYFQEKEQRGLIIDFTDRYISIEIVWGDWKHDHLRCDYLMEQLGYKLDEVYVTEEDESDTYSGVRTYIKDE